MSIVPGFHVPNVFGAVEPGRTFCDFVRIADSFPADGSSAGGGPGFRTLREEIADFRQAEDFLARRSDETRLFLPKALLEASRDPRYLLFALRQWAITDPGRRVHTCLETTHPGSLRSWDRSNYRRLFESAGFRVESETPEAPELRLSASVDHYTQFLKTNGLPGLGIEKVLVTDEHSAARGSGGIGNYCEQVEKSSSPDRLLILFVGPVADLPPDPARYAQWILPRKFLDGDDFDALPPADRVLRLVEILAFYYPSLRQIEFPDHKALGLRCVQAKQAGLLPRSIELCIRCHGTLLYLEEGNRQWLRLEDFEQVYQEKVALENADHVSFPTRYLESFYRRMGYEIPAARISIQHNGFHISGQLPQARSASVDTLIFYGKRTPMKGFPSFVDALEVLADDPAARPIKRVIAIGPIQKAFAATDARLRSLRTRYEITEHSRLNLAGLLPILRENAPRSLVALPYENDNLPYALFDTVNAGCNVIAANAGGIPEFFPSHLHDDVLHHPGSAGLAAGVLRFLRTSPEGRQRLAEATHANALAHFGAGSAEISCLPPPVAGRPAAPSSVGVIVPCFNTSPAFLADLALGLNQQSWLPTRVVFVNDGSADPSYGAQLREQMQRLLKIPFEIVDYAINRGLAGARNAGLAVLDTRYVINLDSDDVPLRHFVRAYADFLDANPQCDAVTSYNDFFNDGSDWRDSAQINNCYRPLGEGVAYGHLTNCFGHANSAFRTEPLREFGGWDATSKAMWEDWALFLKLRARGKRIGVIPQAHFLYRLRANSMSRTYDSFGAERRLANLDVLPLSRFEALRMKQLAIVLMRYEIERNKWPFRRLRSMIEAVLARPRLAAFLKYVVARMRPMVFPRRRINP